jgi:serine/threonine protein kinase
MGLGRGASVLARLHSHGLVYGDISHNNLFMSGDFNSTEVWLIDADNLRFAQADSRDIIYTWEYGAPEIMQGKRGINFRTDTHAFAVLAFKILMMQHPFKGSYVEEAPEDEVDWAGETPEEDQREARALRGEIPWIFDEEDSLNHSNNIFESLFPNPELKRLFNRTFGPGRTKFHLRPAIMHWPEALVRAADSTVLCRKCGMTYYIDLNNRGQLCPFCDVPRTSVLNALAYNFNYKGKREAVPAWSYSREYAQDVPAALPERLFVPFPMDNCDRKGVEITVESNKITIRQLSENLNLSIAFKSLEGGNFRPLPHNMRIPKEMLTDGFSLMSSGEQPRLINITFLEGVK